MFDIYKGETLLGTRFYLCDSLGGSGKQWQKKRAKWSDSIRSRMLHVYHVSKSCVLFMIIYGESIDRGWTWRLLLARQRYQTKSKTDRTIVPAWFVSSIGSICPFAPRTKEMGKCRRWHFRWAPHLSQSQNQHSSWPNHLLPRLPKVCE